MSFNRPAFHPDDRLKPSRLSAEFRSSRLLCAGRQRDDRARRGRAFRRRSRYRGAAARRFAVAAGIHVRTLAAFGTRHSLSSADDPARGIGAARRWIKDDARPLRRPARRPAQGRVRRIRPGRHTAHPEGDDARQCRGYARGRRPHGQGTNAGGVRTLRFDVRQRDEFSECDAPGANDDASGTAVVMELACTFAKSTLPRHARLHGGRRRGAGPARRRALGAAPRTTEARMSRR